MCQGCTDVARRRNNLPANKEIQRRSWLKQRYGITPEQYDEMFAAQGGACAICGRPETGPYKNLQIDHCHTTGKVRGLLCHYCNKALGLFEDDSDRLVTAAVYLTQNAKDTASAALVKLGADFGFGPNG